jgi:hypothetical protein
VLRNSTPEQKDRNTAKPIQRVSPNATKHKVAPVIQSSRASSGYMRHKGKLSRKKSFPNNVDAGGPAVAAPEGRARNGTSIKHGQQYNNGEHTTLKFTDVAGLPLVLATMEARD